MICCRTRGLFVLSGTKFTGHRFHNGHSSIGSIYGSNNNREGFVRSINYQFPSSGSTTLAIANPCRRLNQKHSQSVSTKTSKSLERDAIVTDEGIILHQADPSISESHGLIWGSVLWPSGVSLSKFLMHKIRDSKLHQKRILEMGCGTGIAGLTMAKFNTDSEVILSDSESALWPLLRKNIAANIAADDRGRVTIHGLDWRDPTTFLPSDDFDLILAADVLYSGMDKLFARALASHLSLSPSNEAWIACPFRKDSPLEGWFKACQRLGIELERLENPAGQAVGAHWGVDPDEAFANSDFVPVTNEKKIKQIVTSPTFGDGNEQKVQIFRARRVSGSPEEAIQIRRVSRI